MSNITVNSSVGLTAALKSAHSGDKILLQAGTYSDLVIHDLSFAGGVTITSADPAHQAVLTDFLVMRVDGLTFSNLELKTLGTGTGFNISKSQNIHFDHDFVHGSLDGNAQNDGSGLGFLDSSGISVTNSEFTQLRQAIGAGANVTPSVSNILFSGNNIHGVVKTGIVFSGASNVTVTGNTISDIRPLNGDHPDAIQFFTRGTTVAAHDIVVSDNIIQRGDGEPTQGIFFRDQVGTLPYERVVIANNLIVGTGYGGILVMGAKDLEITGNELVSNPGKGNITWILVQNAERVRSMDNKAVSISYDKVTGLSQNGDVIVPPVRDLGLAATRAWTARRAAGRPTNR